MAFYTKHTEHLSDEDLPETVNKEQQEKEEGKEEEMNTEKEEEMKREKRREKQREKKLRSEISKRLKPVSQEVKGALDDEYNSATVDEVFLKDKGLKFLSFLEASIFTKTAEESASDDDSDGSKTSFHPPSIHRLYTSEVVKGMKVLAPLARMKSTTAGDVLYICYICYISCVYKICYICYISYISYVFGVVNPVGVAGRGVAGRFRRGGEKPVGPFIQARRGRVDFGVSAARKQPPVHLHVAPGWLRFLTKS
jgi:hypothetical protein